MKIVGHHTNLTGQEICQIMIGEAQLIEYGLGLVERFEIESGDPYDLEKLDAVLCAADGFLSPNARRGSGRALAKAMRSLV